MFGTSQRKKGKLYAKKRLQQAQQARFSDGSADNVSYVDNTEREIRAELWKNSWANIRRILAVFLVVAGIAILGITAYHLVLRYFDYRSCTESAEGTVADLYEPEHLTVYSLLTREEILYPIIEYEADGNSYLHEGTSVAGSAPYSTGLRVNVKYNPNKPDTAYFTTEFDACIMNSLINFTICLLMFVLAAILRPRPDYPDVEEQKEEYA